MEIVVSVIIAVAGIMAGAGGVYAYNKKSEKGAKDKADNLIRKAGLIQFGFGQLTFGTEWQCI